MPQPGPAQLTAHAGPDEWLAQARLCRYLPEADMKRLCEIVKECLMEESNIVPVEAPVTVCGDIHGQFYDLLELFTVAGGMPGDQAAAEARRESDPADAQSAMAKSPNRVGAISAADIEPPTQISDPKVKRKMKRRFQRDSAYTSSASNDGSEGGGDDEMDIRGRVRSRSIGEQGEDEEYEEEDSEDGGFGISSSGANRSKSTAKTDYANGKQNFIFLGDFVDRGYFSLETFTLLMCLKAKYPDKITLVRGNHESRQITQVYGFYEECQQKYGNASVWKSCCQVFDFLALAAIIDGKVLCVHGGLSPEIRTLDQIRVVARAQEIPHEGAFCDLVWSDPEDVETWAVSPRGAGWLFGDKVSSEVHLYLLTFIHPELTRFAVQPCQQSPAHCTCPSACQRRVQVSFCESGCRHGLVSTKLLLSLRERRLHYDVRRRPNSRFQNILCCARPPAGGAGWKGGQRRVLSVIHLHQAQHPSPSDIPCIIRL